MYTYYKKPIGIIYSHHPKFNPLLKVLFRRGVEFEIFDPSNYQFDPAQADLPYSLLFNDMSLPWGRQIKKDHHLHALRYLRHIEQVNLSKGRIINGTRPSETLTDRSIQLSIFTSLGIPFPKTRIVNSMEQLLAVSNELKFPLLLKDSQSNGAFLTQRFADMNNLMMAVVDNRLSLKNENAILVQEYIQPKGNRIVRTEILNGKVINAVETLNVADTSGLVSKISKQYPDIPLHLINTIENISRAASLDVGVVEYLTDRKTNQILFTGIFPHTNEFDPTSESDTGFVNCLADYIERRYEKVRQIALAI